VPPHQIPDLLDYVRGQHVPGTAVLAEPLRSGKAGTGL